MRKFAMAAGMALWAAGAHAATIDFNATPAGEKSNPFVARGQPGITFFSFAPDGLSVVTRPEGDGTPGLLIAGEDNGNFLFAAFDAPVTSVSLSFGNDDPARSAEGDVAVLFALDAGGNLLGLSTVVLNRNDLLDQTITYSGAPFAGFAFAFDAPDLMRGITGPGPDGVGLSELIDNIVFEPAAVPGPAASLLLALGLGFAGWLRANRR